jgi:hypothetical protein
MLFFAGRPFLGGQTPVRAESSEAKSQSVASSAYRLENFGDGTYRGKNAAQQLTLQFSADEARLNLPHADGAVRVTNFGRQRQLLRAGEATVTAAGNRIAYEREAFTEWYVNDARGLEQGFTFERRPEGPKASDPLVIAMSVTGGLRPELSPNGDAVLLCSDTGAVLRYAGLRSWDALGREIPSHLEAEGREIRLVIQDHDAAYPLTVDPSITSTTTLMVSPTPGTLGGNEMLTATVTSGATGTVTFYDGTNILGVASVIAGTATFNTPLLPTGANSLKAHYNGDSTYAGSLSSPVSLKVNAEVGADFLPATPFTAHTNPQAIAQGQFINASPIADLAVANSGSNDVSILIGNGTGGFGAPTNIMVGPAPNMNPWAIAVSDFNGDGNSDLAVVNNGTGNVSILTGDGLGGFTLGSTFFTVGTSPVAIAVADLNGDGFADLAVVNSGSDTVSVLLGNGMGGFTGPTNYPVGINPVGIAIADFNGDGAPDLAVVNSGSSNVSVLLGYTSMTGIPGTFQGAIPYAAGTGPRSIVTGQFHSNTSTNIDIAVGDALGNVTVLLGNGMGGFPASKTTGTNLGLFGAAVGDFNADGKPDLAITAYTNKVSVLLGNGDGTFQGPANYGGGNNPDSVVVGEFNGDQTADLAVADFSGGISVLLGSAYTITATSGGGQSAQINQNFAQPLVATVENSLLVGVPGVTVTFTAPASAPTATFGTVSTVTATTDASGKATSPTPTADGTTGTYNVSAAAGFATPAEFSLTNTLGPFSITPVSGGGQSAAINTTFANQLVAIVKDSFGNPVVGATVIFSALTTSSASATFGGQSFVTAPTLSNGEASSGPVTANGIAGTYMLAARVMGVSTPATFFMTNTGPMITASSGTPQSVMINSPFSPLVALVTNAGGMGVGGVIVTFTAPVGGASGTFAPGANTAMTNSSGVATSLTFTANSTAGSYTVTASAPGYGTASYMLTNLVGPAVSITATGGTPQAAVINTAFASPLSATVKDAGGNGVSGVTVTFTAPPGPGATGTFAGTNTAITGASGIATSAVFTANGMTGTYTVQASALALAPANFSLTNSLGIQLPAGVIVGLGRSAAFPVTLGSPAPPGGLFVTLSSSDTSKVTVSPSGFIIPGGATTSSGTPTVTGVAFGSANISASATGYPTAVQSVQAADTLSFSPAGVTVPAGTIGHLFLFLSAPAPMGGQVVNLSSTAPTIAGVPSTVTIPAGSTSMSVAVTGIGAGPATIHASNLPFIADTTASVSVISGTPASVTATSGTPQSVPVNTTFAPLVATVKDGGANPVGGVMVTFTAPPLSGPSGTFAGGVNTIVTNSSGVATATFTANGLPGGPYTVTASVSGVAMPASFSLTNLPAAVPTITATNGGGQSQMINMPFPMQLSAIVKNSMGNPVGAGVVVTFSAPTAGASGTFAGGVNTATTNTSGVATSVTFTANSTAGNYSVTATTTGAPVPATFSLTNLPGSPFSIAAVGGTPQTTLINTAFSSPLVAVVRDSGGNPVPNAMVTFTPPASGQSGTFFGGMNTAVTNGSGVATSMTFTANGTPGSYNVTAASGAATGASFALTNTMSSGTGLQLPVGLIVGLGGTALFPVTLSSPAPPGGLFITLGTSNSSVVGLMTANILIPPGQTTGSGRVSGVAFGTATITASVGGIPAASTTVQTADVLSFVPNTGSVATGSMTVLFLTIPVPAPPGGLTINVSSSNTGIATVPATVTIPPNGTSASVRVTGVSPGPVIIHASQLPNIADTTASVTVH